VNVTVTNPSTSSATLVNGYQYITTQFDANGDGVIDPADIFYLVHYLFLGGAGPIGPAGMASGDANGDGVVDSADIFYLVAYLFLHGPAPASEPSQVVAMAAGRPFSGTVALGEAVGVNGKFVVPVTMSATPGSEVPQALALRLILPDGAVRSAAIRHAGVTSGMEPAFEFSRRSPNALTYLVSFDSRTSRLVSGVVAEIEIEVRAGARVVIEIDPAATMLSNSAGTRKATVAGGTLRVKGTTIDGDRGRSGRTPQPKREN
jgi:hypothetical protein